MLQQWRITRSLSSGAHSRDPLADPPYGPAGHPESGRAMIAGAHTVIYSKSAEEARAFLRDILGFDSVDAGGGWLVFALPPAELAVHPSDGDSSHELYLMCDDLDATMAELSAKGVKFQPVT